MTLTEWPTTSWSSRAMRARSSATAARASASRSRLRRSARWIAARASASRSRSRCSRAGSRGSGRELASERQAGEPGDREDEGNEAEVAEPLGRVVVDDESCGHQRDAEPDRRSIAPEEHSEQEGRGENGDEVAERVRRELPVDDGSDDADDEDRRGSSERVAPPCEQREDHGRGPRRVQPGRAVELPVAVVQVERDLDRRKDCDSDDESRTSTAARRSTGF